MVITSIMDDRNITKYRLAKNTGIPYTTISNPIITNNNIIIQNIIGLDNIIYLGLRDTQNTILKESKHNKPCNLKEQ